MAQDILNWLVLNQYTDFSPSHLVTLRHLPSLEGILEHGVLRGFKFEECPFQLLIDNLTDSSLAYDNQLFFVSFSMMFTVTMILTHVLILTTTACH